MSNAISDKQPAFLPDDGKILRAKLLHESPWRWCKRYGLGVAYSLRGKRVAELADIFRRPRRVRLPTQDDIGRHGAGFSGFLRDRQPETILTAARRGFFPRAHSGPQKWWSPAERAVMHIGEVHIPKRLRRTLRTSDVTISFDTAFEAVLSGCAERRPGRPHLTWITPKSARLYLDLYDRGHAHSVEVRDGAGALIGGLFGVSVGPVFSALSMFHTRNDASKIGIVSLYHHLESWGFAAVDHETLSAWVEQLGARLIPRADYAHLLQGTPSAHDAPGPWQAELSLKETADWVPGQA
jgi:leucyl/phenylalanyl-tRNA--protein transferase